MTQTNGYTRPFGHVIPLLCNMARSSSAEDMQLHSDPGSADCSHRRTHGHCMCPRALQNNLSTSLFTLMLEFHRPICPAPACSTLSAAHTLVTQTTPGMQMWILGLSPRAYGVCNKQLLLLDRRFHWNQGRLSSPLNLMNRTWCRWCRGDGV